MIELRIIYGELPTITSTVSMYYYYSSVYRTIDKISKSCKRCSCFPVSFIIKKI